MALLQSTLATALENLIPTVDDLAALTTLAQAFGDYIKEAAANAVPVNGPFVDASCVPVMAAAMSFPPDQTPGDAALDILNGINAFWGAAVVAPASFIAGATVITPPPYATLVASLTATLISNRDSGASGADAAAAIAADIHPLTDGLGTATFGAPVHPIT